ncbi:hypothetical protein C8J57DRAFT_1569681 [Mycena rebaudengoi]|nr:hypothetical protein C8J57DRAFT_1569681 [Mycena rebaudengoi]
MDGGGGSANAAASLPVLSDADIAHAIALIHAVLGSPSPSPSSPPNGTPAIDQATAQTQLIALQSLPAAWSLIPAFLSHLDPHIAFFGAHTAHVKIVRDLGSLPRGLVGELRGMLVRIACGGGGAREQRVVRRKLYGAIGALAVRGAWDVGVGEDDDSEERQGEGKEKSNWVVDVALALAGAGERSAHVHELATE